MLTSGVALMFACGMLVTYEMLSYRRALVLQTQMLAKIVGDNSAAAINFQDAKAAGVILETLKANPHVICAYIYDANDRPFASYFRSGASPLAAPPARGTGHRFTADWLEVIQDFFSDDYLELFQTVTEGVERVGTVYVRQDMLELRTNLERLGYLVVAILIIAFFVVLVLTRRLMKIVTEPILELEEVVREVGVSKDFSIRAVKPGDDEVGSLIDGFNRMLDRMEQHESDLEAERRLLELRVKERTLELASSLSVLNATIDSSGDGILAIDLAGRLLCYNTTFASMWGIPDDMLQRKDNQEMVNFVTSKVVDPERFLREIGDTQKGPGLSNGVTIELKDGRTFERMIQPQFSDGETAGIVYNFRDITETRRVEAEREETNNLLLETSRQAGMAEVATSVLHNVGNVLNSVNISCSVIADKVRKSRIDSVRKIAELLGEHVAAPVEFFTQHPAGQKLPMYVGKLATRLETEQAEIVDELQLLARNIEHIKDIVAMQQSYSRVSGVMEYVQMSELVENSLQMNAGMLFRHEVEVVREYAETPRLLLEKHKVLQILVNLIRNAKQACEGVGPLDKRMTVRLSSDAAMIRVEVSDNGVGIAPENLTRIFAHGFTTKPSGNGYGLHSGALAAREMNGSLSVHSAGLGTGATFVLELPLQPATHA